MTLEEIVVILFLILTAWTRETLGDPDLPLDPLQPEEPPRHVALLGLHIQIAIIRKTETRLLLSAIREGRTGQAQSKLVSEIFYPVLFYYIRSLQRLSYV